MLRQMAKVSWFHSAMYENIVAHRASRRDLPLPPFDACVGEEKKNQEKKNESKEQDD